LPHMTTSASQHAIWENAVGHVQEENPWNFEHRPRRLSGSKYNVIVPLVLPCVCFLASLLAKNSSQSAVSAHLTNHSITFLRSWHNAAYHFVPHHTTLFPRRSNSSFHEDKGIDQWLRSRLDDYKDSGYDRGHLVSRWLQCWRYHVAQAFGTSRVVISCYSNAGTSATLASILDVPWLGGYTQGCVGGFTQGTDRLCRSASRWEVLWHVIVIRELCDQGAVWMCECVRRGVQLRFLRENVTLRKTGQ
jgi:hypothetical protein